MARAPIVTVTFVLAIRVLAMPVLAMPALAGEGGAADDDLDAALAEVAAADGIVTDDDLASAGAPAPFLTSGRWTVAARLREGGRHDQESRLDLQAGALRLVGRWRLREGEQTPAGWVQTGDAALAAGIGTVALQHGAGIVAAASSRPRRLAAGSSLGPSRTGWRGSTALADDRRPVLLWGRATVGPIALGAGYGRDREGERRGRLRLGLSSGRRELSLLLARDGPSDGASVAGRWRDGAWTAHAEVAAWQEVGGDGTRPWTGRAVTVTAGQRSSTWRLELQAAMARAVAGPAGGHRPACLLTWRGVGWCLRTRVRLGESTRLGGLAAWSRGRDPDTALGDRRQRQRLDLSLAGRVAARGRWRLQLRGRADREAAWSPEAPWLPPRSEIAPLRLGVALHVQHPVADGRLSLDWRQQRDDGHVRQLLRCGWRRDWRRVRLRAEVQSAWGEAVNLVSLAVPVPGYYVVQHWGRWVSGGWLGLEGRGAWRWQLAVVARWPVEPASRARLEGRLGLRLDF